MNTDPNKNKNRYTSSRLSHILGSLPYAFKSIFAKRDKKLIVFCAMHCETFDSNSKFLFLYFLENHKDYNVKFVHSSISEIELLNAAFENMATHLHEREKELRFSANRDSLTGLRNVTSYKRWVEEFDKEIENKTANFGVVVFDLNHLKETNDTYGHDVGDKLIVTAAKVISDVLKRSPVFRIGGDEFLAILQHRNLENYEKLFVQLDLECAKISIEEKGEIPVSIARGFAMFDADKDLHFNDVFKRADQAMYGNKKEKSYSLNTGSNRF